jgi:hypothetical protein
MALAARHHHLGTTGLVIILTQRTLTNRLRGRSIAQLPRSSAGTPVVPSHRLDTRHPVLPLRSFFIRELIIFARGLIDSCSITC